MSLTNLPRWKCHKEVHAARIERIEDYGEDGARLLFACVDEGIIDESEDVGQDWMRKHSPEVGGYFVRYADGYESYSPAAAFESGYTRI